MRAHTHTRARAHLQAQRHIKCNFSLHIWNVAKWFSLPQNMCTMQALHLILMCLQFVMRICITTIPNHLFECSCYVIVPCLNVCIPNDDPFKINHFACSAIRSVLCNAKCCARKIHYPNSFQFARLCVRMWICEYVRWCYRHISKAFNRLNRSYLCLYLVTVFEFDFDFDFDFDVGWFATPLECYHYGITLSECGIFDSTKCN